MPSQPVAWRIVGSDGMCYGTSATEVSAQRVADGFNRSRIPTMRKAAPYHIEPMYSATPSDPSLDVEACVRLLKDAARRLRDADAVRGKGTNYKLAAGIDALASALPGMGKDSRDAVRYRVLRHQSLATYDDEGGGFHQMRPEETDDYADTMLVHHRNLGTGQFHPSQIAARAAQPEEPHDG